VLRVRKGNLRSMPSIPIIVKDLCFEVFGVPLEELASAWEEELVKAATDWGSAEESAKVV
jgi:hypothetical protein